MNNEIIFYIKGNAEEGFEARALGFSIFTQGDSLEELRENIREAVRCHFNEGEAPRVLKLHFVHEEAITL